MQSSVQRILRRARRGDHGAVRQQARAADQLHALQGQSHSVVDYSEHSCWPQVGSVVAVGFAQRHGVEWGTFRNIFMSWIVTLPATGAPLANLNTFQCEFKIIFRTFGCGARGAVRMDSQECRARDCTAASQRN